MHLKRSWGGSYENVSVMVAIGVNGDGDREVIGCAEGFTESKDVSVNIIFTISTNAFSPIAPTRIRRIRQRGCAAFGA